MNSYWVTTSSVHVDTDTNNTHKLKQHSSYKVSLYSTAIQYLQYCVVPCEHCITGNVPVSMATMYVQCVGIGHRCDDGIHHFKRLPWIQLCWQ